MENKYGKIFPFTKDIGKITKQTVEVVSFIPMETSMKVIGKTIKLMAKVFTTTMMVVVIQDNGLKTYSKALELRDGLMDHIMRANIEMGLSMEEENLFGLI